MKVSSRHIAHGLLAATIVTGWFATSAIACKTVLPGGCTEIKDENHLVVDCRSDSCPKDKPQCQEEQVGTVAACSDCHN